MLYSLIKRKYTFNINHTTSVINSNIQLVSLHFLSGFFFLSDHIYKIKSHHIWHIHTLCQWIHSTDVHIKSEWYVLTGDKTAHTCQLNIRW